MMAPANDNTETTESKWSRTLTFAVECLRVELGREPTEREAEERALDLAAIQFGGAA